MSEDFFVYYKAEEDIASPAILQAVSPARLNIDSPFIRIPHELGSKFNLGEESPDNWHARWNPAREKMEIARKDEPPKMGHKRGFRRILESHERDCVPDIIVTWYDEGDMFIVTGSKLLDSYVDFTYRDLEFLVTEKYNPNILYFRFVVSSSVIAHFYTVTYNVDLPEDFSIFTRMYFDGYLLGKGT